MFSSQMFPETAKVLSTVPLGGQAITPGQDRKPGLWEGSWLLLSGWIEAGLGGFAVPPLTM